jgi:nitrate reductase NapA
VNQDFVSKHVNFKKGETDIGFGLRPTHPLEKKATSNGYPGADGKPKGDTGKSTRSPSTNSRSSSPNTRSKGSKLSGVPAKDLIAGRAVCRPEGQGVSFWTMGFNQHTRGTWVNNMIYNVHLLVGKISEPATARSR